jgi:hypothetical protein
MHEPIRDNLEDYLRGSGKIPQDFHAHLAACGDCASELHLLETQAKMLRSLQAGADAEPRPGFYGRLIERIEQQQRSSFWSVFLEPSFGRRLAVASATLVLLLGTYFVSAELTEPQIASAPSLIQTEVPAPEVAATKTPSVEPAIQRDSVRQEQRRDAVLVDLASYRQ